MKSIYLFLSALLFALTWATELPAQHGSSQILPRGYVAAVPPNSTDGASPAISTGSVAATAANADLATGHRFPSFSPSLDRAGSAEGESDRAAEPQKLAAPAITVAFSLAVVLGLFAGLVWITRKFGSQSINQSAIPKDVLQGLGSTPIDARTRITLVRCGKRILVIAQTATGVHPLCEIADPDEVRELSAACLGNSKQAFASALQAMEQERTSGEYVTAEANSAAARTPRRLFATA